VSRSPSPLRERRASGRDGPERERRSSATALRDGLIGRSRQNASAITFLLNALSPESARRGKGTGFTQGARRMQGKFAKPRNCRNHSSISCTFTGIRQGIPWQRHHAIGVFGKLAPKSKSKYIQEILLWKPHLTC